MKQIDCSSLYLPILCKNVLYCPSTMAQCIVCVEDGTPIAGVVYDGYNGQVITAHIWVEKTPSREWLAAIFDYPFNKLGVHKIIGEVNSSNNSAAKLDEHFGFRLEGVIKSYFEGDSDLMIYTMTKDQCRILNSPKWSKIAKIVEAA